MANDSPLEIDEQITVVQYLEIKGLKFTAIPNSTFSKHPSVHARNKREGLRKGLPDLLVIVPIGILFIEMKRRKASYATPEQKEWIAALNATPGVAAQVCKGSDEAIEFIESYL